jgi:hypothetical protein
MTRFHYSGIVGRTISLLLVAPAVLLAGCLSVAGGGRQALRIETEPPGAEVAGGNEQRCTTPCEIVVSKRNAGMLQLRKEGFTPVDISLDSRARALRVAGMIAGNLAFGMALARVGYSDGGSAAGFAPDLTGAIVATMLGLGGAAIGIGIDLRAGAHRGIEPGIVRVVLDPAEEESRDQRTGEDPGKMDCQ